MLDEIIDNPAINKYLVTFQEGDILFYEADESQDLYILVSGQLQILKGNKMISEVSERGSSLGEVSFLLGTRRTATVKAGTDGTIIRIPKEKVNQFLKEFPSLAWYIPRILAQRLEERTQAFYVLKEFCDELPDAVIATDNKGKVISWNTAAEKLFGRTWEQMRHSTVEDIYEEPEDYKAFIKEVQSKYSVRERVLKVRHAEKGTRYISTSTTVLYDGHHNFQGVLSLSRDVTDIQNLQRKYRRARLWLTPSIIFLGLLAATLFFAYPHFSDRAQIIGAKQQALRDQIAKDFLLLRSLLTDPLSRRDTERITPLMEEFFWIQQGSLSPYLGLVLLGKDKKVISAYSPKMKNKGKEIVGSSYAGITFQGSEKSLHKVLTLYRADPQRPMGRKGVEVAFEMRKRDEFLGWLLFQMDMERLRNELHVNEETLKKLQFQNP